MRSPSTASSTYSRDGAAGRVPAAAAVRRRSSSGSTRRRRSGPSTPAGACSSSRGSSRGFVAPAYAYTRQLRESLRTRFAWWAGAWALHPTRSGAHTRVYGPPIGLAAASPLRRIISPALIRVASRAAGPTLRVDLHSLDLASASHMLALEEVIRRAVARRACVTYDDLAEAT